MRFLDSRRVQFALFVLALTAILLPLLPVAATAGTPAESLDFYTLTSIPPCRVYDSRQTDGPLMADASRNITLVGGICAVPADAVAVALNVTVAEPSANGSLSVYPMGVAPTYAPGVTPTLPFVASLSYEANRNRGKQLLVELGPGGQVTAAASAGTVQLIIDVSGYFLRNQAPVVTTTAGTTGFTEDGGPVKVDPGVTVTDVDSPNLASAMVTITNPQDGPAEVLNATNPTACASLTVTPGLNSLSITGSQPPSTYQDCLQWVTYDNTSQNPGTTARVISFIANDGSLNSAAATKTVTVTAAPDAPVADDDSYNVNEGGTLNEPAATGVLIGDTDPDGSPLSAILVTGPLHASSFTLNADGSFSYSHDGSETTSDSFTYKANDGSLDSNVATVTITIAPVNDAAALDLDADDSGGTAGSGYAITFTEGDAAKFIEDTADATISDIDSATLASLTVTLTNLLDSGFETLDVDLTGFPAFSKSYDTTTDPSKGVLTLSASSAQPIADFVTLLRKVTYLNSDDNPDTTARAIQFVANDGLNNSNTATTTVTMAAVNDAPVADNDSYSVSEGGTLNEPAATGVLNGDTDAEGNPLSALLVSGPLHGSSFTLNTDGSFSYSHDGSETTSDTFTYKANDGTLDSNVATVTITINAVNDAPVADDDSYSVSEGATLNEPAATGVLNGDTDPEGSPLSAIQVSGPLHASSFTLNTDGSFSYTHDGSETTSDSFTYKANDGSLDSNVATVTITIVPVNDAPALDLDADNSGGTAGSGYATTFTEGDTAKFIEDTADATITDADSATLVSLTVTLTNLLDSGFEILNVDLTGFPAFSKTYDTTTDPSKGVLTISASPAQPIADFVTLLRKVTYLNSDENPVTTARAIQFVASDGITNSNTATTLVTMVAVNDAPVADNDSYSISEGGTLNEPAATGVLNGDTDLEGSPLSAILVTGPLHASSFTLNADGSFSYSHDGSETTSDTFTYKANDGTLDSNVATVTITITAVNDAPVADDDSYNVNEGGTLNQPAATGVLNGDTDAEGSPLSAMLVSGPLHASSFTLNADGSFNYVHDGGETTSDTFTYRANDGSLNSNVATVTITINPVNDPPVADNDSYNVNEGGTLNQPAATGVLNGDTDAEGSPLSAMLVSGPLHASSFTLNSDGSFSYVHDGGETTSDSFTYKANDGSLDSNVATVTITINPVNDPPTANPDTADITEEAPNVPAANTVSGNVLTNDTDPDSSLVVSAVAGGSVGVPRVGTYGSVTINSNGSFTYTLDDTNPTVNGLAPGGTLTETVFGYTASDGLLTSSSTLTVTIHGADDPATPDNDAADFIGNTELRVDLAAGGTPVTLATTPSTLGVLDGDVDPDGGPPITVSGIVGCGDVSAPFDCVLAGQGTVSLQSNGRFTFVPDAGDTDPTATFQYTLTGNPNPGIVTLTRFSRVWYVKNNQPDGGLGRSTDPFDTLAEAEAASVANDTIYVYSGDGLATKQNNGISLKNGQRLIGEGVVLDVPVSVNGGPNPTFLRAAGTHPLIHNSIDDAGEDNGVVVNATAASLTGIEIRGLGITGRDSGIDITATGANNAGVTIANNVVTSDGTTGLEGVDVNANGTGTVTVAVTNNGLSGRGNAFDARTGAASAQLRVDLSNNTNILSNASGVVIDGSAGGNVTITGFANNTVSGNTVGVGINVASATFDATPGAPFQLVSGGTTVVGASGPGAGAGSGVIMTNVQGNLSFTDLDVFADNGPALRLSSTTAYTGSAGLQFVVGSGVATIEATGGPAVDINQATVNLQLSSLKSTSSTTTGVALNNLAGTFSAPSGSSISGVTSAAGTSFQVGSSNAAITYGGTITTTLGKGIDLTNNTGSTISFTGALTLSSGTNTAFNASGGGTVTATNTSSTLTTTTGTALNVASTTVGSGGLKFQSISANGAANGITLSSTGTSGGLVVSGTGSVGSGGTIQSITNRGASFIDAAGIELNWMNFTNAATTNGGDPTNASSTCGDLNLGGNLGCNAPIHLVNVTGIGGNPGAKLNQLNVNGSAQVGININNVTGLNLTNTTLTGIGNQVREFGLKGRNLKGTVTISGVSITGSFGENFRVENNDPSAVVTVTGSTFGSSTQGGGFFYLAQDDGQIDVTVSGSSFSSNFTTGLLVGVSDPASTSTCTADLDASGGSFNNNNAGIQVISAGAADTTFNLHDITSISGNPASGIALDEADNSTASGSLIGRIQNNTVTQPLSGSGNGIGVTARGAGTTTIAVTGNAVTNRTQYGIFLHRKEGLAPGILNATVTGNNVTTADVNGDLFFPIDGIRVEAGAAAADTGTLCAQISGNTSDGAQSAADNPSNFDLKLRHRFGVTYRLPGLAGSTSADAINLMNTNNPAVDIIDATTTSSYTGGAACPTPP